MAKRRRTRRGDAEPEADGRPGRGVYVLDLALEARLLGRFRLLTINAVVDVAEPATGRPVLPGARRRALTTSSTPRRADAEALLGDAERTLTG